MTKLLFVGQKCVLDTHLSRLILIWPPESPQHVFWFKVRLLGQNNPFTSSDVFLWLYALLFVSLGPVLDTP